jgi:hypothetical protein
MRKVLFKKWITEIPQGLKYPDRIAIEGTNCWEPDFIHKGLFHQWAAAYEESTAGFGNYTVGLIELPDGTMAEVLPSNIKFIEPV